VRNDLWRRLNLVCADPLLPNARHVCGTLRFARLSRAPSYEGFERGFLSGPGIFPGFAVRLRPCPDTFWRFWCLAFASRIAPWRCTSSCVVGWRRCRRAGHNRRRLVVSGDYREIARRRWSGCRCRRIGVRSLRLARLLRPWLGRLHRRLGCPSWICRRKAASEAGEGCRRNWPN